MSGGRMYSPSPTVASSPTPFYLRGMGQDPSTFMGPIDTSIPIPDIGTLPIPGLDAGPGIFSTVGMDTAPLVAAGLDSNTADLVLAASVNGEISNTQFQQILSGQLSPAQINNMIFGPTGTNVPAGPFPSPAQQMAASQVAAAGGTAAQIAAAAASVKPGSTPAQIASAVAAAMRGVSAATVGPSPRITTPVPGSFASMLTKSSIVAGVPDALLIGGGLLILAGMMGKR